MSACNDTYLFKRAATTCGGRGLDGCQGIMACSMRTMLKISTREGNRCPRARVHFSKLARRGQAGNRGSKRFIDWKGQIGSIIGALEALRRLREVVGQKDAEIADVVNAKSEC